MRKANRTTPATIPIAWDLAENAAMRVSRRDAAVVVSVERGTVLVTRQGDVEDHVGRHPLLGRMYLPAYRAGTEKVAELRRRHPDEKVIPALFFCRGVVDVVTVDQVL